MVSFDCDKITWHCPCAKPRQSCIHKYIAKWHLFQTEQGLFRRRKCVEEGSMHVLNEDMGGSTEQEDGVNYPPTDKCLQRMVRDIFKHKKLPALLPPDATNSRSFPTAFIPSETFCRYCPGPTMLSEPSLITSKAKIVTFADVIEGACLSYLLSLLLSLLLKWPLICGIVIPG